MKYQGGKGRIAKRLIAEIGTRSNGRRKWVEPFVGGAWTLEAAHLSGRFDTFHAGDSLPDIIMLYRAVAEGWRPPHEVTREMHHALKKEEPSALRALVGFGSSYGGTFFAGFCGDAFNGTRTNADIAATHLDRQGPMFETLANLRNVDYREWDDVVDAETVLYCDPPYADTYSYRGVEPFDNVAFWEWCRRMADRGAAVFVSEYTGAPDAVEVWSRTAKQTAARHANHSATERLFQMSTIETTP